MNLLFLTFCATFTNADLNNEAIHPYFQSCFSAAGNLYEFGDTCYDAPFSGNKTMNNRCPCSDLRFVETVVNCYTQLIRNVTSCLPATNTSLREFSEMCGQPMELLRTYQHNTSNLLPYDGDKSANKPGAWPVTRAFALTKDEMWSSWHVQIKRYSWEKKNKKYGGGLLGFWLGVLVLRFSVHCLARVFPTQLRRIQETQFMKRYRRNIVFRSSNVTNATAVQVLVVSLFLILTIVFSFIELGAWYPDNTVFYRNSGTFGRNLGMRTGVLALYLLPVLILFAGRNNFLLWLTGWTQDTFVFFHRWVARTEVGLLLAHAIAYSISDAARERYKSMWGQSCWSWGIVGLSFGMFMFVQGLRFIRARAYDLFVFFHIIAGIFFLIGGYYHLKLLKEPIGLNFFYASFAVWGLDRAIRLVRVVHSGLHKGDGSYSFAPFGVPSVITLEKDALVITFDRPATWNVIGNPGQVVYIHFLRKTMFWQSHPFTVVPSVSNPSQVKVFARIHKGITQKLANDILQNGTIADEKANAYYEISLNLLLDGPYGHSHDLFEYDELIFVAGGTGITVPFTYTQNSILRFPNRFQKVRIFWSTRSVEEQWFVDELNFLRDCGDIELQVFHTRDEESNEKLDVELTLKHALSEIQGPTAVLCCGPESMNRDVKRAVAQNLTITPHFLQYYQESFNL